MPAPPAIPGAAAKASAERVEMVAESDYDFIVKAAKKYNYEFFVEKGAVRFRKAKMGATTITELSVGKGVRSFEISYGVTGLVETVEARALNAGNGKLITSSKKLTSTLSGGSKAKGLIAKSSRVYIDPTIASREEADARVDSIMEEMRFRLGSLECECVGIPELLPGHYVSVSGVGSPVANTFYITRVTHELDDRHGYCTRLWGKAAELKV
jgi:phage protein D